MLNLLRQGGLIKGLMGGVVILIIAAFAFGSGGSGATLADQVCVAEVDDSCVQPKEYHTLLRLVAPSGATDKELRKRGYAAHAINGLIERELLLREGRRLGVTVGADDLDNELALGRVHYSWPVDAPLPAAVAQGLPYPKTGAADLVTYIRVRNSETGAFDYNIYKRQVQNLLRMSPREFKELQKAEVIASRVRTMVTAPVRVSEEEAFAAFERERSKATVRTVDIKKTWFQRFAVDLSDEKARAFAEENADAIEAAWKTDQEAWKADCPLVSEIRLEFSPGASEEEQGEKREQATAIKGLLDAGVPFVTLARAFGNGPNAPSGGAVGCLDAQKYGAGGAELVAALDGLKAGTTSDVVETPRGFHFLHLHGSLNAEEAEKLGKLEIARRLLSEKLATDAARSFASKLIELGKGGTELAAALEQSIPEQVSVVGLNEQASQALVDAAKSASDAPEFEVSRPFTRISSPLPGLKDSDVGKRVFELEADDAFIEEPLDTYAGVAVVQLKEKTLATREDFDADKEDLMNALKEQKRADALSRYISRLRERANRIAINPAFDPNRKDEDESRADNDTSEG
jgi:parvulin-like peptidyl-prolyl isomerase